MRLNRGFSLTAKALLVGGFVFLTGHPTTAQEPIRTRLSIATTDPHPLFAGAMRFKEALEQASGGKILVQVFPAAQAGDEAASLQLIRSGGLQFASHSSSLSSSASNEPVLQGWSLPFLYPDSDAAYRAWDSDLAAKSFAAYEKHGFKCMERWDNGFRQLSTNKPINSVEDVRGLKLRTPDGAIYISTWKALGAVPTPMAFTELYTALQTGVVEGTELPIQVIDSSKFYEVQKNFAEVNYMNDPACFSVSLQFYRSLSPELRAAVDKAAKEASVANRQRAREGFEKALSKVTSAGMKVTKPSADAFRAATASVYDDFYKKTGAEGRTLVDGILAITKKP